MIELIAAAVSGAVVWGGVVWLGWRRDVAGWSEIDNQSMETIDAEKSAKLDLMATLTALRSNCFIPDERGVKVRYSDASVARRIKAETPKEVV